MTLLEVEGLHKFFKEVEAVKGIDFAIQKGELIGLLGPNGAGKSTAISMISTLLKPSKGTIYYKSEDISKNPRGIQKKLGVVPQDIALYPTLSGYQNLKFWGHAYGLRGGALKKRIEEVADIIGLSSQLKKKVDTYSGGMKRRINIGAALLHEPELLIMDEPTVGIDPQSRNHILETVVELNKKGMTIIYTSHYMEEVEAICSYIHIMDQGKIIASGTKDELIHIIKGQKKINISFDDITSDLIERLKQINGVDSIDVNKNQAILVTQNGDEIFQDIISIVSRSDSQIISVDIKKPNLEAVFLHLTGKALRN